MFIGFHVKPTTVLNLLGWIMVITWVALGWGCGFKAFLKMHWTGYALLAFTLFLVYV